MRGQQRPKLIIELDAERMMGREPRTHAGPCATVQTPSLTAP